MEGVNVMHRDEKELEAWYDGPTLVECLGECEGSTFRNSHFGSELRLRYRKMPAIQSG